MKEIIKSIKRWILLWDLRWMLVMPVFVLLSYYYFSIRDHWVLYKGKGITIMFSNLLLILLLISEAIQLYAHIYLVKGTSKKIIKKPYKIELGIHDKDEIISLFKNKLQFTQVEDDCFYALQSSIGLDWRVFVFLFEKNSQNNDLKTADQYVKKVNDMTGFKASPVARTMHYTQRANIFIYDKVPQTVLDKAQEDVEHNVWQSDSLTNYFIDLTEGTLYIPFLCTRSDVGIIYVTYLHSLKRVGEYLDLL